MESLQILYMVDDQFKSICDDYCECQTKNILHQKKIEKNLHSKLQFENLAEELAEEILIYLIKRQ
ncbi:hypothetical protein D3C80_2088660 [compost metagenome]